MKTLLTLALAVLLPKIASAHVKWFVDSETIIAQETTTYSTSQLAIGSSIIAAVVIAAFIIDRFLPNMPQRLKDRSLSWQPTIHHLVRIALGLWMLFSAFQGNFLAPTLQIGSPITAGLQMLAIITGLLLLIPTHEKIISALFAFLWIATGIAFGPIALLEMIFLLGFACYYYFSPSRPWALPLLRFWTGVDLIIVGLTEKILHPELGVTFLQTYNWNFMSEVGLTWWSDSLFILCAALSEILFGILLICGVGTRITTIALSFFFLSTAILLGPTEVVGHLPFIATAVLLILYGCGKKITLRGLLSLNRKPA